MPCDPFTYLFIEHTSAAGTRADPRATCPGLLIGKGLFSRAANSRMSWKELRAAIVAGDSAALAHVIQKSGSADLPTYNEVITCPIYSDA